MGLPDKYKTVVYLYYYEGYNSVDISNILKKPQSTIRNYLHEARDILKERLGGDFNLVMVVIIIVLSQRSRLKMFFEEK